MVVVIVAAVLAVFFPSLCIAFHVGWNRGRRDTLRDINEARRL